MPIYFAGRTAPILQSVEYVGRGPIPDDVSGDRSIDPGISTVGYRTGATEPGGRSTASLFPADRADGFSRRLRAHYGVLAANPGRPCAEPGGPAIPRAYCYGPIRDGSTEIRLRIAPGGGTRVAAVPCSRAPRVGEVAARFFGPCRAQAFAGRLAASGRGADCDSPATRSPAPLHPSCDRGHSRGLAGVARGFGASIMGKGP